MDPDLVKLIGGGAGLAAALYLLARVLFRIGERMIAAVDRIAEKVDDHTKADLAHHADVRAAVERLDSKVDTLVDWQERTPVDTPIPTRRQTPPGGVRAQTQGEYSVRTRKP